MPPVLETRQSGEHARTAKMPGHWLLARLGKKVLRPGGMELTRKLIDALGIGAADDVIEFAPGLGITAKLALERGPKSYIGVERDEAAAHIVRENLGGCDQECIVSSADDTGLPGHSATVVYGEAMLTMQSPEQKRRIMSEAARLLRPGGHYGIHEIALSPDDLDGAVRDRIARELSGAIRHRVVPLTKTGWIGHFELFGMEVCAEAISPMRLLEPRRLIQDEGIGRALRFAWNVARHPEARKRVMAMRRVFRKFQDHMVAIMLVGRKR
ncbi:MAG: class I SAM-dependent methyltransferase [Phycisphaerales bacterium]|nr:class I SAM-dependent methyltransferase [Phycisphaerales bacterium]